MKILQICHKPPFPAIDGGCIAINAITRGLIHAGHQVKVVSIVTKKHPLSIDRIPQDYIEGTTFETVFVNTKVNPLKALISTFRNTSYHIDRFISNDFKKKITEILKKETFDIVQLESIFVAPYIPTIRQLSNAKIVLRAHNVEHKIWGRFMLHHKNGLKKWMLKRLMNQLKNYEMSVFSQIDAYMTISQLDFDFFHNEFPDIKGTVISMGINIEKYEIPEEAIYTKNPKLFHIGSMNWMPNIEGLEWFFDEVWNKILSSFPELVFTLAGRGLPENWKQKQWTNVNIVGEVENANDFILSQDIMIVPLLSGSGVRIKILEGMALGKVIITTPIGAEGLDVEHGKNILIANTPQEFVDMIKMCVNAPEMCNIISENARDYVIIHHNNALITDKIEAFYSELRN